MFQEVYYLTVSNYYTSDIFKDPSKTKDALESLYQIRLHLKTTFEFIMFLYNILNLKYLIGRLFEMKSRVKMANDSRRDLNF